MYLNDLFSRPYIQIRAVRPCDTATFFFFQRFRFYIFQILVRIFISLTKGKFLETLLSRDYAGSNLVDPDKFVTDIHMAQDDFQDVLIGAVDEDYDEPHVD